MEPRSPILQADSLPLSQQGLSYRKHESKNGIRSLMSDSMTPWTVAHLAPLFMGFSRQVYWSGLPSPTPGNLPDPGTELVSLASPALACYSLPLRHLGRPKPMQVDQL